MSRLRKLTYSALLLALAVGIQTGGRAIWGTTPLSQFLVGSLINLILIISVGYVGVFAAVMIAILTPVMALLQGHITFPLQVPVVATGNLILPLVWFIFHDKLKIFSKFISVIVGAVLKFAFLWAAMPYVMRNFVLPAMNYPEAKFNTIMNTVMFTFSWPQLVTALVGGSLAIIILRMLPKKS